MFYPSPKIHTGSGAYPVLCSVGTGNAFPENGAAGAWSSLLTPVKCWG